MAAEVGQKWENHQQQKQVNKQTGDGLAPPAPKLTQEQMLGMLDRVRNKEK
jgi:hypothetical protein